VPSVKTPRKTKTGGTHPPPDPLGGEEREKKGARVFFFATKEKESAVKRFQRNTEPCAARCEGGGGKRSYPFLLSARGKEGERWG